MKTPNDIVAEVTCPRTGSSAFEESALVGRTDTLPELLVANLCKGIICKHLTSNCGTHHHHQHLHHQATQFGNIRLIISRIFI